VDVNAAQTGLYDLNSAINLQSNQSTVVALQYKVDGALVGQPFYETVGSGDFIVSLPSQLNLAPGFHTIGLTAENLFDGTVNALGSTFQATAYNSVNGQPAATGTSTTSGNANLFPGGLTNLQFLTVDVNAAQTGLYDLNSAINLQSNQSTVVALQYKVDGALVGQPFYETVGSGDFIVSLPSQLNLAPGFHTIGLTAENLFDGTVNVSGDTFQATAYNNITENATPEPATLTLLGSGLLAIGTVRLRRRRQIRLTPSRDDTAIQA
jgi:hypothetical protein